MQNIIERINEAPVVFDGAMGTALYEKGVFINTCYEALCLSDPELVRGIHAQYVEAGAAGYVLKDDSVDDLVERVRGAHAGQVRVSPGIAAALMSRVSEYAQLLDDVETGVGEAADLTPREREILDLIGQGLTNQQIGDLLVIEVGTVKNHVHSILQKLDASSRHEAAATWAIAKEGESASSMA